MDRNPQPKEESDCVEKVKKVGRLVIAGSVFALVVSILVTRPRPLGGLGHFMHDSGVFCLFLAPWGLATGIGLLRAWRWARISMLVFGGLLAALCAVLAVPFVLAPGGGVLWWQVLVRRVVGVLFFLTPAAIGVQWLIYFTRDNVKAHFRTSRKAPTASA